MRSSTARPSSASRRTAQDTDRHTSHRPRWDDGVPLLHGNTHARDRGPDGHQFHVGVDAHDYAPIPFTVIDDWIQAIPGIETRLDTAIREAREIVAQLDSGERPGMDSVFYVHGYEELHIALEELLAALGVPLYPEGDGQEPAAPSTDQSDQTPTPEQEPS